MSDPAASPAHVGSCLDERYDLVRHIARGGMGDVYEAQDRVLGRSVAVKVFRSATPADRTRFDEEIRLLATLDHPTLVRVYDAGSCGGDAYLVMELVDGPALAVRLAEEGPLPAEEVARHGADLADALASIHARGVVHRDVTTSNVLCGRDGRIRLVDFGIARLLGSPRVTATATTVGTAAYMSPEQVAGEEVSGATDVYSLGLVLLEALTGRRGFEGTAAEVVAARLARDPDTEEGVDPTWRPLLRAMTGRTPDQRPAMSAVRDRLRSLAAARPDDATAAVPVVAPGLAPAGSATDPATASTAAAGDAPTQVVPDLAPLTSPGAGAAAAVGGPGSLDHTAAMPLGAADLGERTQSFATPPAALLEPEPVGSRRPRPWGWAIWAGLAAALVLAVVAWASTEGDRSPLESTTSTTVGAAASVGGTPTSAAPTTVTTVAPAPVPTVLQEVEEIIPDVVDGGPKPGNGKGKDKDDD